MLYFDLAEIYGYETKSFNRPVKNNTAKLEKYFDTMKIAGLDIYRISDMRSSMQRGRWIPKNWWRQPKTWILF